MIGSFEGYLELKNNCFEGNEASLAPVVIYSSTHRLSSNGGRNNVVFHQQCDFAMEYTGASVIDGEPADEIPFSCFSFDDNTCFGDDEKDEEKSSQSDDLESGVFEDGGRLLLAGLSVLIHLVL